VGTHLTRSLPAAVAGLLLLAGASGRAQDVLSAATKAAVEEALQDERRGEAIYSRVLKDHGDVRPFANVVRAERRHASLLEDLLKARGLALLAPPSGDDVPGYPGVKEACAAAVDFEVKNVALYDRLLAAGPLPDDVEQVFDHNRLASLDHHKPAFERCGGAAARRGAGGGCGCRSACGHGCGHGGHGQGGHGCGRAGRT